MTAEFLMASPDLVDLRSAGDEQRFGGKSVNLGQMLGRGLPVPGGVALSWDFARAVAEGDRRAVERLLAFGDQTAGLLAVRSSAVGEDADGASFAGQHLTVLGVEGAYNLVAAVIRVERSGSAKSAQAYREVRGEVGEVRMGVTVQQLVDPDAAGVMFTRNPLDGADERVIEAAWGLGEAVVASRVTPDSFRVSRGGKRLAFSAGEKRISLHPQAGGGVEERRLGPEKARQPCLTDTDLEELDRLASVCEAHFGGPQDIEWAKAEARIWLLQSRPVTTT